MLPAQQAVPLPETASDELAASLGVPALTAYHCLMSDGPVDGRSVLVAGGAGAVGHFAIELGVWAGATVVATASGPEKAALATRAGAGLVVNYRDGDAADRIRAFTPQVDRVVEVALGANLGLDLDVLAPRGTIVCYAAGPDDPILPVRRCMTANVTLRFVLLYSIDPDDLRTAAREVTVALSEGGLTELPVHRFPLDDIAAAHEAVESGVTGKVLVDVG